MELKQGNKEHDSLIRYFQENFLSSTPITSLVYAQENPSYSTLLNAHIRNFRFKTPNTAKPLFILTPTHPSHIQGAIRWAKKQGLQMKTRSGGHDFEGLSYVSDVPFFILDMFNLRRIHVDIEEETAWVQAGATVGEVCYNIAAKSKEHGFPFGVCPTVGVGGHLSGAGYGNMMRKYGLTTDNVIDAELIDVNGRLLNRETMGEDLFWAIRGGGGASFGVMLSYKIKLVRVPPVVTVFRVSRTMEEDNALDIVLQWQEVSSTIDSDLFIRLTMDVIKKSCTRAELKTVRATFISLFLGNSEKLMSLTRDAFPKLGLRKYECREMSWIESVLYWAEFPSGTPLEVLLQRAPATLSHLKRKSDYVKEPIPKEGLELIWNKMIELETPKLTFNPYGGRMGEVSQDEIPFPHRKGNLYKVQYFASWDEEGKDMEEYYIGLLRELYNCMTPFVSKNPRQAYFNYTDMDLGVNDHNGDKSYLLGTKYGIQYFMGNFDRLVKIKTAVDPHNFFKNQQSIPTLPMSNGRL